MNRRLYYAGHAFLAASAATIAIVGVVEIISGGLLAQGLIRIALAFAVVASQGRGIYWDRKAAARRQAVLGESTS